MSALDLHITTACVLVVDVQERFQSAIPSIALDQAMGRNLGILLDGAAALQVPVVFSEQYPKGLGPTLPGLIAKAPDAPVFAKTAFSCGDDEPLRDALADLDRSHVVVAGIEAHVCVLATVQDLLTRGYQVVVAVDAIASRRDDHRDHAIATMRQLGAVVVPVETILFRLQREAGVGAFKTIAGLVK